MLVVADSSALLSLAACGRLPLLDELYGDVRVPAAVWRECVVAGKPHADALAKYLDGRVADLDLSDLIIAGVGLGRGELEALALYKRLHADRLLLNDRRARRVARVNSVQVIGSLGVLLLAKTRGVLPAVRPSLEAIRAAGIHLSDSLVVETLRIAGEE